MPRKIVPKQCGCGCGGMTRGGMYMPGHDQKLRVAIEETVGDLQQLKSLVEGVLNRQIEVK